MQFTLDPAYPWSLSGIGLPALLLIAVLLVGLTVGTYAGVRAAGPRRVLALVALRLAALLLAVLVVLRPSLASSQQDRQPSVLLILVDSSESMTIQDEVDNRSRWLALERILARSRPLLERLRDEQQVRVDWFQFSADASHFDPNESGSPTGKRTDFGQALFTLLEHYVRERRLRALVILSDGADNGTRHAPLNLAARWRSLPCPIHTFALGQTTTTSKQQDLALTSIIPEPSPVPVKQKLNVRVTVNAPGFENQSVRLRLLLDGKEVLVQDHPLRKSVGNDFVLATSAPDTPGEIQVSVRADPLPGEVTRLNNEISTFVTVIKEGISVLLVDKLRFPEPQRICDALAPDPRIRLFTAWRRTDAPAPEQQDLFEFDKRHYDVIILGDVTAQRLTAGNRRVLHDIQRVVKEKGTGLLMMGGYDTFANSDWAGTPLEELLPVRLDAKGDVTDPVQMLPTRDGLRHYVLRLADREADNEAVWKQLPRLEGMTRLGSSKPTAVTLAVNQHGQPMLVVQTYGSGRVAAFAGDTTWQWQRLGLPSADDGVRLHARFWRQLVVWLARQEETGSNVWVRPDARRLGAGGKLGFSVGIRGKGGLDLAEARFDVKVIDPNRHEHLVQTSRDKGDERGLFWKTDAPGVYQIVVHGSGKETDGTTAAGSATARFLVYQEETEMVRQAADHDFLARLAQAGGGKAWRADELTRFLQELQHQPLPQQKPRSERWPDWRTSRFSPFLAGYLLLFVAALCLEWFLRRFWGLV
jgi:uncharacterized membrane protein